MVHRRPPPKLPASLTFSGEKQVQLFVAYVAVLLIVLLLPAIVRDLLDPPAPPCGPLSPGAQAQTQPIEGRSARLTDVSLFQALGGIPATPLEP